jgi:2,3-dihydroxybenzoate-AMP ligase
MKNSVKKPITGVVYLPKERSEYYSREGVLGQVPLVTALREAFKKYPSNVAISTLESSITYRELDEKTDRLAFSFHNMGLKAHDRVVFQLPNIIETIICFIGCLKADLIPVCTLQAHRQAEIGYLANHAKAKAHIIVSDETKFDYLAFAKEMQKKVSSLEHIIVAVGKAPVGTSGLNELIRNAPIQSAKKFVESVKLDPWQVAMFQLSGGTSGIPKIIPRFSNEYLYQIERVIERITICEKDKLLLPTPVLHNSNLGQVILPAFIQGAQVLLNRTVTPQIFFKNLIFKRPTIMGVAGPLLEKFKSLGFTKKFRLTPKGILGWYLLKPIRFLLSMNLAEQSENVLNIKGGNIYGMTEGLITLPSDKDEREVRFHTQGYPLSEYDEVKIVKPGTEEQVKLGEVGELIVRGPYTVHGYFDAEERNEEAFTSDGFYKTGDLLKEIKHKGKLYYRFEGRTKDVIDRGAEKINAEEVENFVRRHEAISDVAIVAYPCPDFGERACACIIINNQQAPDIKTLGVFLETQGLAKYKWPERIEIYEEYPTTSSGKLSKPLLREDVAKRVSKTT